MKQLLHTTMPDSIRFNKRKIKINPSFRTVMKCSDILEDELLSETDKIDICLWLFVRNPLILLFRTTDFKAKLFTAIFEEFVNVNNKNDKETNCPKVIDLKQDAKYIYAAFQQAFGIDLNGKDKNIHWWEFVSLLSSLPDDTRIMQIVSIRSRPIPKPTKYNAEERQKLIYLKSIYKLTISNNERERNLAKGLWSMVRALGGMPNGKN